MRFVRLIFSLTILSASWTAHAQDYSDFERLTRGVDRYTADTFSHLWVTRLGQTETLVQSAPYYIQVRTPTPAKLNQVFGVDIFRSAEATNHTIVLHEPAYNIEELEFWRAQSEGLVLIAENNAFFRHHDVFAHALSFAMIAKHYPDVWELYTRTMKKAFWIYDNHGQYQNSMYAVLRILSEHWEYNSTARMGYEFYNGNIPWAEEQVAFLRDGFEIQEQKLDKEIEKLKKPLPRTLDNWRAMRDCNRYLTRRNHRDFIPRNRRASNN